MTSKELSKIRRNFKRRLITVTNKAQTHCGHEGPAREFYESEDALADYVVKLVREKVEREVDEAVERCKKLFSPYLPHDVERNP